MIAKMITRCEVYMTVEEQKMLNSVLNWIERLDPEIGEMPEQIQESLDTIYNEIEGLLGLIPEEH